MPITMDVTTFKEYVTCLWPCEVFQHRYNI